ncbi:MAG: hypothetical protein ACI9Y1_002455 [Lentisphaeria bacterium]|jgi:hypothetical protein
MTLQDLIDCTCLVGLSYFDTDNQLLRQNQVAGRVVKVDETDGISIQLFTPGIGNQNGEDKNDSAVTDENTLIASSDEKTFIVPAALTPWFKAPKGQYRDADKRLLVVDPDYFVTWDIYKTQEQKKGLHEWWDWVPRTAAPKVN